MTKLLSILLIITNICFSQIKDTFSKYDSLLMKEVNILRKSYGLHKLKPSLKLRINVTNVHMKYLLNIEVGNTKYWAYHPEIINTNENLRYSRFKVSYSGNSYNMGSLSILYVIDVFYKSSKIKKSKEFLDSFYKWVTYIDTVISPGERRINKLKLKEFKDFANNNIKDFWLDDFKFKFYLNVTISTYTDFLNDKGTKDDGIYFYEKETSGRHTIYTLNGTYFFVRTYLNLKDLFVNKMKLDITYLFNKENYLDKMLWETKESLYGWYNSPGHKDILLLKNLCNSCKLAKHISVSKEVNYLGYSVELLNIQNEDDELIILKKEEYDKLLLK